MRTIFHSFLSLSRHIFRQRVQYIPISHAEDDKLDKEEHWSHEKLPATTDLLQILICSIIVLTLSIATFVAGALYGRSYGSQNVSVDDGHIWGPLKPAAKTSPTKYHGSFESVSEYRGAGPEVDKAWNRFADNPWISGTSTIVGVSEDDIESAGKRTEEDWFNSTAVLAPENGEGYMATVEVFHQLHCLDKIRKATYPEHYQTAECDGDDDAEIRRKHLDHCIEIIRQVLMCNSDLGLVTFHWVKGNPTPYPDFNTWHQCRDPEAVLQLAKAHEAHITSRFVKTGFEIEMPFAP